MQFALDNATVDTVLNNFGRTVVQFAADAECDDVVTLRYDRDALLELGLMILHVLRERAEQELD
jgi:hypothetical protein